MQINFRGILATLTETEEADWRESDGPESRVGQDYYFQHERAGSAYINRDQGHTGIEVDGVTLFAGELEADPNLACFITD